MKILKPSPEVLKMLGERLRAGELVGMPTETVYGLAGNAFDEQALARIFSTKERPTFDPLIVHISLAMAPSAGRGRLIALENLGLIRLKELSEQAQSRIQLLMDTFWPGPLTLVLPKSERVPDLATSGLPTVAIRMPRHSIAQALISSAGVPLAAPSANRFGRISPTRAEDVDAELGDRIEWTLDGGPCEVGLESTVLSVANNGDLKILRPGGVAVEEIEKKFGLPVEKTPSSSSSLGKGMASPGMLESHYAPQKELKLLPRAVFELSEPEQKELREKTRGTRRVGLLLLSGNPSKASEFLSKILGCPVLARTLSETGSREEAARALFSELRAMDSLDVDLLLAEPCLDTSGLGYAIADRLRRSSAPKA
jgi:L-threonylcarbamoyladenylate synthase